MRSVVATDAREYFMDDITKKRGYAIGAMSRETGVNIEKQINERIGNNIFIPTFLLNQKIKIHEY